MIIKLHIISMHIKLVCYYSVLNNFFSHFVRNYKISNRRSLSLLKFAYKLSVTDLSQSVFIDSFFAARIECSITRREDETKAGICCPEYV